MFKPLKLVDAQELLLTPLDDPGFIVEDLIPGGVTVIAGDEKSGKSWMMLLLATCIATGQDFLGHPVKQGAVLYLSLEDTYVRLQRRLFNLTNEVGYGRIMLSIQSGTLDDGLMEQLGSVRCDGGDGCFREMHGHTCKSRRGGRDGGDRRQALHGILFCYGSAACDGNFAGTGEGGVDR